MKFCIISGGVRIGTFSEKLDCQAALKYVGSGLIQQRRLVEEEWTRLKLEKAEEAKT